MKRQRNYDSVLAYVDWQTVMPIICAHTHHTSLLSSATPSSFNKIQYLLATLCLIIIGKSRLRMMPCHAMAKPIHAMPILNPCTDKWECVHAKYVLIIIIGWCCWTVYNVQWKLLPMHVQTTPHIKSAHTDRYFVHKSHTI